MFAVFKTGGKNYKVTAGQTLTVEKIDVDAGERLSIDHVTMINDDKETIIGSPIIDKSSVKVTVLKHFRDDKILVYKKKRRQGYDRLKGHKQHQTVIYVDEIIAGGKSIAKAVPKTPRGTQAQQGDAAASKTVTGGGSAAAKTAAATQETAKASNKKSDAVATESEVKAKASTKTKKATPSKSASEAKGSTKKAETAAKTKSSAKTTGAKKSTDTSTKKATTAKKSETKSE